MVFFLIYITEYSQILFTNGHHDHEYLCPENVNSNPVHSCFNFIPSIG